jgi:FkbM family methyltransferase
VPIDHEDPQAWQSAQSYRLTDIGLAAVEQFLNDYYERGYAYLDVGSNRGIRSLYALSIGRPTILFEPNDALCEFARRLFDLNGFTTYSIEHVCVSDRSGAGAFYVSPTSYMSSLDREHARRDGDGKVVEIQVQMTTLDAYLDANVVRVTPKVIKIDVEGAEYAVLQGAAASLARFSPTLVVEILDGCPNRRKVFDFLDDRGYACFGIWDSGGLALESLDGSRFGAFRGSWNYLFTKEAGLVAALRPYIRGIRV